MTQAGFKLTPRKELPSTQIYDEEKRIFMGLCRDASVIPERFAGLIFHGNNPPPPAHAAVTEAQRSLIQDGTTDWFIEPGQLHESQVDPDLKFR